MYIYLSIRERERERNGWAERVRKKGRERNEYPTVFSFVYYHFNPSIIII